MRIHRMGHQCMKKHNTSPVSTFFVQKHRMASHFARLDESHTLWQMCSIVVASVGGVNNNKTGR